MELYLKSLVEYALNAGLIEKEDRTVAVNRLLELLGADAWEEPTGEALTDLEEILKGLLDYAAEKGIVGKVVE